MTGNRRGSWREPAAGTVFRRATLAVIKAEQLVGRNTVVIHGGTVLYDDELAAGDVVGPLPTTPSPAGAGARYRFGSQGVRRAENSSSEMLLLPHPNCHHA